MSFKYYLVFVLLIAWGTSCRTNPPDTRTYVFLGHPYDWNYPNRIDHRLENVNFDQFDQVWLGGDVCSATTQEPATLAYLDSLFHLSQKVHWTVGNHDLKYEKPELITRRTRRPLFYQAWENGICILVLNTNLYWWYDGPPPPDDCAEKEAQWAMIQAVCDTIREATHLLVLHHHALLVEKHPAPAAAFNINARNIRMTCDSLSDFTNWCYPLFEKVQKRGVQVVTIGGDLGMAAKRFEHQTPEGIWLLGSGINNTVNREYAPEYVTNFDPDEVLVFKHRPEEGRLEWEFMLLEEAFLKTYGK